MKSKVFINGAAGAIGRNIVNCYNHSGNAELLDGLDDPGPSCVEEFIESLIFSSHAYRFEVRHMVKAGADGKSIVITHRGKTTTIPFQTVKPIEELKLDEMVVINATPFNLDRKGGEEYLKVRFFLVQSDLG